ncbi:hypothetical protein LTR85_005286 [Meristemomyces frigidus]|nr:hypothetical protein LTR85_005286 [Meristemomyces frigidus]
MSGRCIELCYSLKSVEPYDDPERPWSIRQCSIYHAFDLETNKTTWITVKGNEFMRDLLLAHLNSTHRRTAAKPIPVAAAFQATLAVHLLFCHWASENWHWYINSLESSLQQTTRRTLSVSVDPPRPMSQPSAKYQSTNTARHTAPKPNTGFVKVATKVAQQLQALRGPKKTHRIEVMELPCTEPADTEECPTVEEPSFSFGDLQHVQFVEEKAAEVLLVLKANSNIITQLRDAYSSFTDSDEFCKTTKGECRTELREFATSTNGLVAALAMQQSRAESLVRLVAERKSLLYGILQYQNMEANRLLAEKAHVSALRMEEMTREMQVIAHKTKAETVSMRIITLVTLFFLPGTFISTLMSTPIITFDTDSQGFSGKNIGTGALAFYVAVSVPLVCFTFLAWYAVYWWETRRTQREARSKSSEELPV